VVVFTALLDMRLLSQKISNLRIELNDLTISYSDSGPKLRPQILLAVTLRISGVTPLLFPHAYVALCKVKHVVAFTICLYCWYVTKSLPLVLTEVSI
jgi:hypothetical protein